MKFNVKFLAVYLLSAVIFSTGTACLRAEQKIGEACDKIFATVEVTAADLQKPLNAVNDKIKDIKIKWSYKYVEALDEAQKSKRPLLIFACAAWCGWCKKMERETCADKKIVKLTESFVCIKLNFEEEDDFFSKFKVKEFPSVVFLNSDGTEIERHIGFKTVDEFEKILVKVLEADK